jgi:DNA-binding transcriptional regulator YiaG
LKIEVNFSSKKNQGGAMTIESESFSERVKKVRSQLNLSQEDLAHAIGVSFATVNRWENGKTLPSKLALKQFNSFCATQKELGHLND